ncbi:MAG: deoxyribodipyrimidine photo-lyase [Bacteroidetes bacterium]|nr:deoxyribodipyrimidine photo-lyase [Bacteroidota bacterium]
MPNNTAYFWFRRDLRIEDNCGFYHALISGKKVIPVFILDTNILDDLEDKRDKRLAFILEKLRELQAIFRSFKSDMVWVHESPLTAWKQIFSQFGAGDIYANRDYEPYAIKRDLEIADFAYKNNSHFFDYKDQVIFEKDEIVKDNGLPYTVYTPYSKKWKTVFHAKDFKEFPSQSELHQLLSNHFAAVPAMEDIGFISNESNIPKMNISNHQILNYVETRDFPAKDGTTKVSTALRFGSISIRSLFRKASEVSHSEKWMNELIWREFYSQILWHFPNVVNQSFKPSYDRIVWRNNEEEFHKWCEGKTGYPMVDAGMRELHGTGYMHNRVRMVTASFLTKHLLIDWRWGESYFASKLLDYDLASNNGGWQWAAGSGVDAAPYFRIFNPSLQVIRFDPDKFYIRKWIPELNSPEYPEPIVSHEFARERCLKTYQSALNTR